jgi:biopolymer transport protein ExbD/biopolymer transport protein TolR
MPRRSRRHRYDLNADVNVVSLIDVMLLLLVIFMITAPLMQGGVDVQLPEAQSQPLQSKEGMTITVNKAGEIFVDNEPIKNVGEFRVLFKSISKNRIRNGVYLRADQGVPYGIVVQLMAIMNANGVNNVGFVTEPENIPK